MVTTICQDLRAGWDLHVEFGLANPAVYALMADSSLSTTAREAVVAAITTTAAVAKTRTATAAAIALRAGLGELTELSAREHALLDEWLARIAAR